MATLRITVQVGGSGPLEDTEANRKRMFVFSGTTPLSASTGNIGGNIEARVSRSSDAYDLNRPKIPGTISVTSYRSQTFLSADLLGQPGLLDQLADAIEGGYVEVLNQDEDIAGQTGAAASMAAVSGGLITVTGLTGMTADHVGGYLTFTGGATGANNDKFYIMAYNSATSVDILAGSAPGNDANNGALNWTQQGTVLDRAALATFLA
jgi:hypothetical protein